MIEQVGAFIDGLGTLEYVLVMAAVTVAVVSCLATLNYLRFAKEHKAERRDRVDKAKDEWDRAQRRARAGFCDRTNEAITEAMAALDLDDAKPPNISGVAMDGQYHRYYTIEELISP